MKNGASVIVCCFNSASRLPSTLDFLSKQEVPDDIKWEIILVDNASTDNTHDVARELWDRLGKSIPLTVVREMRQGLSFARQRGVSTAKFETLIFCDDDNWLDKDYVANAHELLTGGHGRPYSNETLPSWFENHRHSFACHPQGSDDGELADPLSSLYGAGLVVRKSIMEALNQTAFTPLLADRTGNSLLSGGDTELCYAIRLMGYKVWYSRKLVFVHFLPASRLTEQYVLRLNQSLSLCSARLLVYRYVLQQRKVTADTWWKDFAYSLFALMRSSVRFLRFYYPLFERRLSLEFSYYNLRGIMMQYGKYKADSQRIHSLRYPE
jgi:glycosyltransferase involved in cell wall biosynthesis